MTTIPKDPQGSPRVVLEDECKPGRFQAPVVTLSRHPAMAWDEKNRDEWAKRYLEPLGTYLPHLPIAGGHGLPDVTGFIGCDSCAALGHVKTVSYCACGLL